MASKCPKCGGTLKITDWRPNCPHCGVNLVYFGIEDRLLDDADKAETEHAHFQKKMDRLKAAFVGSKIAIVRFSVMLLPVLALLLPLGRLKFEGPFIGVHDRIVNLVTIISGLTESNGIDFDAVLGLAQSNGFSKMFLFFVLALGLAALSIVFCLLHLIFTIISCSKRGCRRNIVICTLAFLLAIGAVVTYFMFCSGAKTVLPGFITGASVSWGAFIYALTFLVPLAVNIIILRQGGVKVEYKQCYVGGLPFEEYEQMVKDGMSKTEIRKHMAIALKKLEDEREATKKAKQEAEAAKEAEEKEKEPVAK